MKTNSCWLRLATAALMGLILSSGDRGLCAGEAKKPRFQLQDGDIVALCGDSITSSGTYPLFLEAYQLLCCPNPKITYMNFGRWGEVASQFPPFMDKNVLPAKPTVAAICYGMNNCRSSKVMAEKSAEAWADSIKVVTDRFKQNGTRRIVLASPGCVDSNFFALSQTAPFDRQAMEATQKNLSMLRDSARRLAAREGLIFADMHTPMIEVMAKAQARYGKEYAFAGGRGDGVHPGSAGHLVMAWVYLKALGYDGAIGAVTVQLDKDSAQASEGHSVLSFKEGSVRIESARSPFCFLGDRKNPKNDATGDSTRSVVDLFPFNDDLNRLTLIVRGAKARRLKITWGGQTREFNAAVLEKGVNLAAEFLDSPFCEPFAKCLAALRERNACRQWLKQDAYKNNPSIPKRLEAALKALEPVAVTHSIQVEELR
jgi:hypothetical protein